MRRIRLGIKVNACNDDSQDAMSTEKKSGSHGRITTAEKLAAATREDNIWATE